MTTTRRPGRHGGSNQPDAPADVDRDDPRRRHASEEVPGVPDADLAPVVSGMPMQFLRSEGLVLFAGSLAVFFAGLDEAWWLVPLLLFVPDVAIAGYARSNRAGALAYNLAHSSPAPALLGALAVLTDSTVGQGVALIWFAHIGMDRALGYGLKYETDFNDTHLGRIGSGASRRRQVGVSESESASVPAQTSGAGQ
jgi:hypothetical protein